ncbi:TolB family protein [Salimicrobium halophilum]|uniref:WD40-like Beta Propeller Repeat n=1 Tax=Salimicrobium halophilum TaxID=86666 RepID=A0A1G8R4S9_9BACI|nr:PD40 domain-containing protein [Salimicrobium halophilum]SDJ11994.1 WD40-like Beta Propeller Repeat [Salimicrobium halophilum]
MRTKKKNILFLTGMVVLFGLLYGAGVYFAEEPVGKSGFTRAPALSEDGEQLAFVHYNKGVSSLYTVDASGGGAKQLLQAKEGKEFEKPAFSPNGSKIAYLRTWRTEGIPYSQLMMYDLERGKNYPVQSSDAYISKAVFAPSGDSMYVAEGAEYDEQPQGDGFFARDYDVHEIDLASDEKTKLTDMGLTSLSSIEVFPEGERLLLSYYAYGKGDMVQIFNMETENIETLTADSSYESGAMDGPSYGAPAISPEGDRIAFSDVTRTTDGTYEYEVMSMNMDGTDVKQVTEFYEMTTEPIYFPDGERMLVTVDQNFAGRTEEYEYWSVDLEGNGRDKIEIDIPEEG